MTAKVYTHNRTIFIMEFTQIVNKVRVDIRDVSQEDVWFRSWYLITFVYSHLEQINDDDIQKVEVDRELLEYANVTKLCLF